MPLQNARPEGFLQTGDCRQFPLLELVAVPGLPFTRDVNHKLF